ncbi:MAG: MBL fold metallo-hydrolase [Lachnospiraceae bacterium]|nr:MBL fold metallo-hydrolase [uncultured Acetatifactor sp.]MCI8542149.1 MBL fold metallo-hydrolase [Lachnospiraceae bacterium]
MQTTLYMLQEQRRSPMMSFILQTKNGKIIVIDGGFREDAQYLLDTLTQLGGPNPEIELWLLTHPHLDHADALPEIFTRPNPPRVKAIYSRFLSYEFYKANDFEGCTDARTTREFNEFAAEHPDICHTFEKGQRFAVDSAVINVLRVPEDESLTNNAINNSSVVFRLDTEGQRILFVGDLGEEGGDRVLATVPREELRADFIQMAHHGENGVKKSFYEAVGPRACLWTTPGWLWDNDKGEGQGSGPWRTLEVRGWMEELGIGLHFVTKDGDHKFVLPYPLD